MIKGLKKGRKSKYSDEEITEMREMYAGRATYDQIAAAFKCSHGTVSYYCVEGHKAAKVKRQLSCQRADPDKYRAIRNRHRNKYSTYYQRRWRWSKKLKDLERQLVGYLL